jgi:hypothetical protein
MNVIDFPKEMKASELGDYVCASFLDEEPLFFREVKRRFRRDYVYEVYLSDAIDELVASDFVLENYHGSTEELLERLVYSAQSEVDFSKTHLDSAIAYGKLPYVVEESTYKDRKKLIDEIDGLKKEYENDLKVLQECKKIYDKFTSRQLEFDF